MATNPKSIAGDLPRKNQELSKAERDSLIPILSHDNPESIYNRLDSTDLQKAVDDVVENHNYLLTWGPDALEKRGDFSVEIHQLRMGFWREYENSIQNNIKMSFRGMLRGICTPWWFNKNVATNPKAMMFILHQPTDYTTYMEECLVLAAKNIREILKRPNTKIVSRLEEQEDGTKKKVKVEELDHTLINQKIKIWEKIENRVKGIAPQTLHIQQTSKNYNYNENLQLDSSRDVKELDAEIKKLEAEKPIEIEAKVSDG